MVEGMESIVVTVSGYHGSERLKLIKLINHAGSNYVGKMSRSATHLICWKFEGRKYELAKKFGTIILNHRWLEDCLKEGKRIPEQPYTLQSGKEVGFILDLPVLTETVDKLTDNKAQNAQSKKPNMFDRLNNVIDLDSDDKENDDWDDWLLDESLFPRPESTKVAPQRSKRKAVRETLSAVWQPMTNRRRPIREPHIPTIDKHQEERNHNHVSMRTDLAESSRRSRRRLVRKGAKRDINGSETVHVNQQSRRETDISDLSIASSLSNSSIDFRNDIEANICRRLETNSYSYGRNRDDKGNHSNNVDTLGDSGLQGTDTSCFKETYTLETSSGVNLNRQIQNGDLVDISPRLPTSADLSCVICWTEFSQTRGILPCGHRFCFSCIQNWSDHMASNRKESTCPLCKASFASITRVEDAASLDQKIYSQTVPDPSSAQDIFIVPEGGAAPPENEIPRQSVCCTCQSPYPEDLLIFCQMCQSTCVHSYCLDPPLFPWTCNTCRDRRLFYHH